MSPHKQQMIDGLSRKLLEVFSSHKMFTVRVVGDGQFRLIINRKHFNIDEVKLFDLKPLSSDSGQVHFVGTEDKVLGFAKDFSAASQKRPLEPKIRNSKNPQPTQHTSDHVQQTI